MLQDLLAKSAAATMCGGPPMLMPLYLLQQAAALKNQQQQQQQQQQEEDAPSPPQLNLHFWTQWIRIQQQLRLQQMSEESSGNLFVKFEQPLQGLEIQLFIPQTNYVYTLLC
jgi:hypothetical protein